MSAVLTNDPTPSLRETLNLVVLYDDRVSRDHVLRIRDHLVEHFGGELEVACSWWKFEFLAEPHFATAAAQEVARADVILFAIHSAAKLPAYIQTWLDRAVSAPRTGKGLVALLGAEDLDADLSDIDGCLQKLAYRGGLDYLGASANAIPSELARRSISHRADTRTSVMDDILNYRPPPRPRWGINE
jgi:hypothetical protein